jgi:hypothetical protein
MIHARPRCCSFLSMLSLIGALCTPITLAANNADDREVRIVTVSGDVRLSPGDGKRPDLNRPWELAQRGDLLEQGASVATGNGRAEIEFENGSTAYLAENSLLSFPEISSGKKIVTRMSLLTGVATFSLRSVTSEYFFITTPTDQIEVTPVSSFFARLNSYLNVTAVTFQGGVPEDLFREGLDDAHVNSGQSITFQGGKFVVPPGPIGASRPVLVAAANAAPREFTIVHGKSAVAIDPPPIKDDDFDRWVAARRTEKASLLSAALQASGLSTPVPGLADLYANGDFFRCEPYGTCWERSTPQTLQSASATGLPSTESPAPTANASTSAQSRNAQATSTTFQPTTVDIAETISGECDAYSVRHVSHLASTQAELDQLLELKARLESAQNQNLLRRGWSRQWCYDQAWIPRGRGYAMVVRHPVCAPGKKCHPIHPPHPHPHPVFVSVAGKIGFVPRHPDDSRWKPPLNGKNGVLFLPTKPGEPPERTVLPASQKFEFASNPGRELDRLLTPAPQLVSAPEIHARLWPPSNSISTASAAGKDYDPQISYNYKLRAFTVRDPGSAESKEVVVARANSAGSVHTQSARGSSSSFNRAGSDSASRSNASRSSNSSAGNSGSRSSGNAASSSSASSSRGGSASSYSPSPSSSTSASSSASSGGGSHPH